MDSGFFKFLISSLGIALAALPVGAVTTLDSKTTTFTGTVPSSCEIGNNVNTVTMTLTTLDRFEGQTNDLSFDSNVPVTLSLTPVTVSATPSGTSSYTWTAALIDNAGGTVASTTDSSSTNSTVAYNNGVSNTNLKIRMSVASASGNIKTGTYTGSVTVDCLSQ